MANTDNPRRGAEFEGIALNEFSKRGIRLSKGYSVDVGVSSRKKPHKFDLGSANPQILIECKRHTWTKGGNSPSAKMSVWNEAMFYFAVAPEDYRKILYVLKSSRKGETLAEYYIRRFEHLIPEGVEIWEHDTESGMGSCVYPGVYDGD